LKFKSSKDYRRKDAMKAARLGSVLVHQFCNVKKPHFRHFEQALVDANNWAKSQANLKECYIAENEISFWAAIVQKFKAPNGYTGKEDQIELDRKFLPQEITDQLKVLDEVDHDKFVEGIDTESVAYQYINRLNQFRIEQSEQINMQTVLLNKGPFSEQAFNYQLQKLNLRFPSVLFGEDYDIHNVVGLSNTTV